MRSASASEGAPSQRTSCELTGQKNKTLHSALGEIEVQIAKLQSKWGDHANIDFDKTPFSAPNGKKVFGTVDTPVDFLQALGTDEAMKCALSPLLQVPMRFYRDNVIAGEEDAAEHIFFVVRGIVRSCKIFEHGARNIVAFYLPGDLFGWTDLQQNSLTIEAATDTEAQTEYVAVPRITQT
jgi:Cyclic nucleotide-binding domain